MHGTLIPRGLGRQLAVALTAGLMAATPAAAEIPQELYEALGIASDAPPNVVYEAVTARYRDTAQGAGQGKFAELWEPIAFSAYLDPTNFYTARDDLDFDVQAGDCASCHESITPTWVHTWQSSVHGDLDAIRALPDDDSRAYKKAMITEVEGNLRSMGLLAAGAQLGQVGCADCHMGVGSAGGNHKTDLQLPDAASCGQCHVKEFAERESERDT